LYASFIDHTIFKTKDSSELIILSEDWIYFIIWRSWRT